MKTLDQLGREVNIPENAKRIVSLVPSQTELLADLDLADRVVGITRFCELPQEWFYSKARIGGTKDVDLDRVSALQPDLILGNAEENTKKTVQELSENYPVWLSDVKDLKSAVAMIASIGNMTDRAIQAENIIQRIQSNFAQLTRANRSLRVLYLIWKDPYMAAGRDTFINAMLEESGFENVLNDPSSRYPKLDEGEITALNPDLVLLSSEPYPFKNEHVESFERDFNLKAKTVDGAMFSWYGSRLIHAPAYFEQLQSDIY